MDEFDLRREAWRMIEEQLEIERQMLELVRDLKGREDDRREFSLEDWEWAKRKLRSNSKRK